MGNARRAGALARAAWHQERAGTCDPPGPSGIGVIGEEHLRRLCTSIGGEAQSFKYFLSPGYADGLPYVVEIATCAYKKWVQEGAPGRELGPTRSFLITAMTGERFEPNAHGGRRPERRTGLTRGEAARHPGATENGTARHFHNSDFSRHNPLRWVGLRRGRPCHADGSICLPAGTSSGIGTGFS